MTEEIVKGFKATDEGMKCRGYQYEMDKWHNCDGKLSMCNNGFHFCENPLSVLDYYDLCTSEFYQVEAKGKTEKYGDKTVSESIKFTASIGLPGFIKASVEYVKNVCKVDPIASGHSSKLAASGHSSQLAASGDSSKLAASGDYSKLAASGDSSQLAASGDYSKLAASGDYSKLAASGDYSIAAGIGINNIAKGVKGSWLVLAEWEYKQDRYVPVCVKTVKIDGKKIKENVFYKLTGGKFVAQGE